ncbi:LbtU family siderophore porin [Gammaproteobacteria bacterium]|nr:LbtU family siderophore porin [Gammaproteobacteria bacterium]
MNLKPIISLLVTAGVIGTAVAGHPSQPAMKKNTATKVSSSHAKVISGNSAFRKLSNPSKSGVGFSGKATMGYYLQSKKGTDVKNENGFAINNINLFLTSQLSHSMNAVINARYGLINTTMNKIILVHATEETNKFQIDEAYATYFNEASSPVYVKVGRYFQDFGNYKNPYIYNQSISQSLTQFRGDGVTIGGSSNQGIYGNVYTWQPVAAATELAAYAGPSVSSKKPLKNFGFKIGYQGKVQDVQFNTNFSMINELAQTNIFKGTYIPADPSANPPVEAHTDPVNSSVKGYQVFAQAKYQGIGAKMSYTAASKDLVAKSSQPKVWGIGASYSFNAANYDQMVGISYEKANKKGQAANLFGSEATVTDNHVAKSFISGSYGIKINRNLGVHASIAQYKPFDALLGYKKFTLYNISMTAKI